MSPKTTDLVRSFLGMFAHPVTDDWNARVFTFPTFTLNAQQSRDAIFHRALGQSKRTVAQDRRAAAKRAAKKRAKARGQA